MIEETVENLEAKAEPVNNIYWIPIIEISALSCLNNEVAIGHYETKTLVEGNSTKEARENLKSYHGYVDNYINLKEEQKKRINPFKLKEDKIEEVLDCEHRFKNKRGDYTCGRPIHDIEGHEDQKNKYSNINGEFGMCVIMGYDIPEGLNCPYKR